MHNEQIEYFALAYQARNFSAAAKQIPMSPQGLAKSIRSLEARLGVTLFEDINGALVPTLYADELLKYAKKWTLDNQELKESFKKIQAQENREIRLGTSLGIIGFMGPEFIESFMRKNPEIKITYNELNDAFCEEGLLKGTYDLAFTLSPYDKSFITTEMYCTQVCFWVDSQPEEGLKESLEIEDLNGKTLAIPGEDFKIFSTIMDACNSHGVTLGSVFTSNEIFWLYEFAAAGKGIAFTLPHLIDLSVFSNNKSITALPLKGVLWRFGISYLASHQLLPHEKLFIDHCMNFARFL